MLIIESKTKMEYPIHICQLQRDTVIIDNPVEIGSAHDTTVAINIRSNIDYSLSKNEWMVPQQAHYSIENLPRDEDGLVSSTIFVSVSYNTTYKDRVGTIVISSDGKIPDTEYQFSQSRYGFIVFDNIAYKTIQYGKSTWMVENLRSKFGQEEGNYLSWGGSPTNNYYTHFWVDSDDGYLYSLDGLLYSNSNIESICPDGWHVSTTDDWERVIALTNRDISGPYVLEKYGGTDDFSFGANIGEWHNSSVWLNLHFGMIFSEKTSITKNVIRTHTRSNGDPWPYPDPNFLHIRCVKGPIAPDIQTLPVTELSTTSAILRADIMNDPSSSIFKPRKAISVEHSKITRAGFKYGTSVDNLSSTIYSDCTEIAAEVTGLIPATIYYYQPFIEYEGGDKPIYGTIMAFKTYKDIFEYQGNKYYTTSFGDLEFMAQNLQAEMFNDGTLIPRVDENADWSITATPAQCVSANDESLTAVYGRLYNQTAALSDKICPKGWRLPYTHELVKSDSELVKICGTSVGAYCLADNNYWINPTYCSNLSALSVLPAGKRLADGKYSDIRSCASFWVINSTTHFIPFIPVSPLDVVEVSAQMGNQDYVYSCMETGFGLGRDLTSNLGCSIRCVREE